MNRIFLTLLTFLLTISVWSQDDDPNMMRLYEVYTYIDRMYVDDVPNKKISEAAIVSMLEELDPHSTYIPASDVEQANERLNGSFVGVGIRFNILKDTLLVVNPIPGGPSEKLGIRSGDQIIKVNGELIAGTGLKNSEVRELLLGEKGSVVKVEIKRGNKDLIEYSITRDKIPVNSVVSAYMVDEEVGYIKLTNFSRTTEEEVDIAIKTLKKEGMKDLIFDLQGNGGGLLYAAKYVADEFLSDDKLIVYSEGRKQPRSVLKADKKGDFEKGRLVVLIDESSASASEILSGAIQDWDRGLVVGRRSFGKGLVQRPIELSDGSQLRLTIARYYTPSGRFIQKPYEDIAAYRNDYMERYLHGEMMHRDSIDLPDSLVHKTLIKERNVYGGGGIMPDVFVPLDTLEYSDYYKDLSRSGVINTFALEYANANRSSIKSKYESFEAFKAGFDIDQTFLDEFFEYAVAEDTSLTFVEEDFKTSEDLLKTRLKAMVAQNLWDYEAFYQIINVKNEIFMEGLKALKNDTYDNLELIEK
ncbi:S41 family peptidase [Brumimicrobium aurantiacum]|uniref:S41 family peptidase n=1 Tax=Brumimicrobium aurantiacum TaxID=1737063 RepID=A0A3E1EZ93_9FLAO|nr:S41 family peptidase [Brumimicrobium aurantiacum]RFC54891.1 S41 family peptidase [Brumimicrobium aurantiacum]